MAGAAPQGKSCPVRRSGNPIFFLSAVGLILLAGERFINQCVGHYAESKRLIQAARREVGVSLCALSHRAIARSDTRHTVGRTSRIPTRVNSVKLRPVCAFIEVDTEGSQDRTHGKVSSTYVYVHKCVECEERRIVTRSDRTRCHQQYYCI